MSELGMGKTRSGEFTTSTGAETALSALSLLCDIAGVRTDLMRAKRRAGELEEELGDLRVEIEETKGLLADDSDFNPRWAAFCHAFDLDIASIRPSMVYLEYTRFLRENCIPDAPGVNARGRIVDHDAFTQHLWDVAERRRADVTE